MLFFLLCVAVSLLLLICLSILYLRWNYTHWTKRHISGPQPQLLVGTFPKTNAGKCNLMDELHEIYLQYKDKQPFVGVYVARQPKLFILDPALATKILIHNFQSFHDNESSQWTSPRVEKLRLCSPFVSTGEDWKQRRSELAAALTNNRLRSFYPTLRECAAKMRQFVKSHEGQALDAKDLANRFTTEFVASFIWGIEAEAFAKDTPSTIQQLASGMIAQSLACVSYYARTAAFPLLRYIRPVRFFPAATERFFQQLATNALDMRRQSTLERCDVINHLLQLKDKKSLSDTQIAGHTTTVLIDGFETGAMLIAHCLLLLSRSARVQTKLRAELLAADLDGVATYEQFNELPYLEQCLQETLRLFPPLPTLFKLCTKEFTLEQNNFQLTLQPNDAVYISSYSFHHDADFYEQPEVFWPERFDEELGGTRKYREMGVFLPFGDGPRICLGMKLGLMEAKVAVAGIVRHYAIKSSEKTRMDNKIAADSFLLCLDGGIELIFDDLKE